MAVRRIVSGGQTGADRTGLEVGKELGLETGGFAPRGWRTEAGPDPSLAAFGLEEHPSPGYPRRTEVNVVCSDGTVIFGNASSPGCRLTIRYCVYYSKPYLVNPTPEALRAWLLVEEIEILNVAGNRKSTNPGVVALTRTVLMEALK